MPSVRKSSTTAVKGLLRSIIGLMQPTPKVRPSHFVAVCVLAACSVVLSAKDFVKPTAQPAKTYPAHDAHTDDKVAIAADPYDTPAKAKIFSVNFADHGFLPVFFIVTNDGDQPISIANMEVKLITANHSKLTPSASEDVFPVSYTHLTLPTILRV